VKARARLAALAAIVVGITGAAATPAQALELGLMDPAYASQDPEGYWADVDALRPKTLRIDVHWDQIAATQPANQRDPADPAYLWGYLDDLVRQSAAHGYTGCDLIATVWRTPKWASTIKRPYNYANMPNVRQFRNFVYAAAIRYSGAYDPDGLGPLETLPPLTCWEIWNEPNFNGALRPQKLGGVPLSAINYTKLLNGAYDELSRVEDDYGVDQQVIGGALYRQRSPKGIGPIAFMETMQARGAKFDVLSIHPYNGIPNLGIRDGAGVGTVWPNVAIGNFDRYLAEVNRLWPGKRFPIWITEFGWQTKTGVQDQYAVSEAKQSLFLRQSVDTFRTRFPRVGRLIWFLIKDEPVESLDGRQNTWQSGFRRLNGSKKPAYATWQTLIGAGKRR
jgi:hypothetical protein